MILRILHIFTHHKWSIVSRAYNPPKSVLTFTDYWDRLALWGFTEVLEECRCGKQRVKRLIGKHNVADSEIEQLRAMAGL